MTIVAMLKTYLQLHICRGLFLDCRVIGGIKNGGSLLAVRILGRVSLLLHGVRNKKKKKRKGRGEERKKKKAVLECRSHSIKSIGKYIKT